MEGDCRTNWMRQADVEDGNRPGRTREEFAELRRRNRLLEQENAVLRRAAAYLSQANLPGNGSTRSGVGYAAEGTPCGRQSSHVLTGYFCWLLVS